MGIFLARELQKYFKRVGNRCVFRNGMSLNKLADELAYEGKADFDTATISRAINGERLFTEWQIRIFSQVLELTEQERWYLAYAVAKDECLRLGIEINLSAHPPTLHFVLKQLAKVEQVTEEGNLENAINLLYGLYEWQSELDKTEIVVPPLIRIVSLMKLEREKILQEIAQSRNPIDLNSVQIMELPELAAFVEGMTEDTAQFFEKLIYTDAPFTQLEQQIWAMHYQQGLPLQDIAVKTGRQMATIYSILWAARQKLLLHVQSQTRFSDNSQA